MISSRRAEGSGPLVRPAAALSPEAARARARLHFVHLATTSLTVDVPTHPPTDRPTPPHTSVTTTSTTASYSTRLQQQHQRRRTVSCSRYSSILQRQHRQNRTRGTSRHDTRGCSVRGGGLVGTRGTSTPTTLITLQLQNIVH